ncbi:unnamed protein product, partial [Laminaria digitata]
MFRVSAETALARVQAKLALAKRERAHELVGVRLRGRRLDDGTIPLRSLMKFIPHINSLLEKAAWKTWASVSSGARVTDVFVKQLDLRLAAIESGSTKLVILGNTAPDLTGESALESALNAVFRLLNAPNESFTDQLHDVGVDGARSLLSFLGAVESEGAYVEWSWLSAKEQHFWDGRPDAVTRLQ